MKKQILVSGLALLGVGVLGFLLARADRLIQRQQQALKRLSAKVERLEHGAASAPDLEAANGDLKIQVDRLGRSLSDLQTQLAEVQNKSRLNVRIGAGQDAVPSITVPEAVAPQPKIPPGWIPFEFNGVTYYRVPLALSK